MTTEVLFLILIVSVLVLAVTVKGMLGFSKESGDPLLEQVLSELEERRRKCER